MSYIRSGSNPEKLYIYGTEDRAYVSEGSKPDWFIPLNIFDGLIRKYHRKFHDFPCEFKGAKVDEVWVNKDNIETDDELYVPSEHNLLDSKVKLTYGDNKVYMWFVTWEYIVNGEIEKYERFIKPKKIYVTFDPLYERVVCVHEESNMVCKKCKDRGYDYIPKDQRDKYPYEEKEFILTMSHNLKECR